MLDFLVVDVIDLTGDVTRNNRVNVTWPADERHRAVHLGWRRGRSHTDRRTVTRIPRHMRVDVHNCVTHTSTTDLKRLMNYSC